MKQSELKLMSIMSAAFSRLKMSPVQIAILSCIGLNPGIRFGEIANRVSVSSSRLCFHLNTLCGAGDVSTSQYGGRFKKGYFLTAQGRKRLEGAITRTMKDHV